MEDKRKVNEAIEELLSVVAETAIESGALEGDDMPNELKCNIYQFKIQQMLCEISNRAHDEDVLMMCQLYEALVGRESVK